ncbi:MAG TPA: glycosyltransferase family 39 protein [Chthoniobacterales bacterium]|nr:glycosyltransferase family 39 protein [Chthoniobacterales bacterium]
MSRSRTAITTLHRAALKSALGKYAILFFGCLVFHTIGTWSLPLIDRDEPRFAEASREMIERGDYIVPHFNNHLRLDKPPFAYWMQVASFKAFGENDFAARFPSAVAAALAALSIFGWGKRITDERVGWWAAIIFTLSLQTFIHAKAAVADMWLVLFVSIAHWSGYELLRDKLTDGGGKHPILNAHRLTSGSEDLCWCLAFYTALGLGFLAKGPIAWTPLLTIGATKLFLPHPQLANRFRFGRGILLMLAIIAAWGMPALIRTHGEFLSIGIGRHVISRSFAAMEGHGAASLGIYLLLLPFYFVTVFASFFPWSIKLPRLARRLWSERNDIDNYLVASAAIIFLIFTVISTKLPHYILPAFPMLSLLVARRLADERKFFTGAAIATVCIYVVVAFLLPPLVARSFPSKQLYNAARDSLRQDMESGAVGFEEPSLVWYFRTRVNGWMSSLRPKDATKFMERAGPRFIVLPTRLAHELFPVPSRNGKTFSTSGFNVAKGEHVELTLLLKQE